MNETNIKHGYSLMVREARGAILNPGVLILKAWAEFIPPGALVVKYVRYRLGISRRSFEILILDI